MSKVGVKQSYGQRYCSITLKHNYVSSGQLLCTLAIDYCLYFTSVGQSEAKTQHYRKKDIPVVILFLFGYCPQNLTRDDNHWVSVKVKTITSAFWGGITANDK